MTSYEDYLCTNDTRRVVVVKRNLKAIGLPTDIHPNYEQVSPFAINSFGFKRKCKEFYICTLDTRIAPLNCAETRKVSSYLTT